MPRLLEYNMRSIKTESGPERQVMARLLERAPELENNGQIASKL